MGCAKKDEPAKTEAPAADKTEAPAGEETDAPDVEEPDEPDEPEEPAAEGRELKLGCLLYTSNHSKERGVKCR